MGRVVQPWSPVKRGEGPLEITLKPHISAKTSHKLVARRPGHPLRRQGPRLSSGHHLRITALIDHQMVSQPSALLPFTASQREVEQSSLSTIHRSREVK